MVEIILLSLMTFFIGPVMYPGPDTEVLVINKYCNDCQQAKLICQRLKRQGYDIEIIDLYGCPEDRQLARLLNVYRVPTLVIRQNSNILSRVEGLLSEGEYRVLINKKQPYYTGVINFINSSIKPDAAYSQIIKGAKSGYFSYREYNPDYYPELVKQYNITRLPTIIFMKLGKETSRYIGITLYD